MKAKIKFILIALVIAVVAFLFGAAIVSGESPQRFVRVGYSDLHDNRSSVHVIRDNETGQCRAYVLVVDGYRYGGFENPAVNDSWPIPCSKLDIAPVVVK